MALYKDSLGNVYTSLPKKPENHTAKGASPGPKHGRRVKYDGPKKKHGPRTGKFRSLWPQAFSRTFHKNEARHRGE